MSFPLPADYAGVTAGWLNAALADTPAWRGSAIVGLELQSVGGADALASSVFRVNARVSDSGSDEPVPLLLKLHGPEASGPYAAMYARMYAAEVYFYRKIAPRAGAPVPATYFAAFDEDAMRFAIVQEFLVGGRVGASDIPLSADDLERVLGSLASMHATWWNSQELAGMARVPFFGSRARRVVSMLKTGELDARRFLDGYADLVSPEVVPIYESMPDWIEDVAEGLGRNFTLAHMDCSAKNLFIPDDPAREPVLFDWALFGAGNPALDLAVLICYSMDPAEH